MKEETLTEVLVARIRELELQNKRLRVGRDWYRRSRDMWKTRALREGKT